MKLNKKIFAALLLVILISAQAAQAWSINSWWQHLKPRTKKISIGVGTVIGGTLAAKLALHWYVGSLVKKIKNSFGADHFNSTLFDQGTETWMPMGRQNFYNKTMRPWLAHQSINYNNGELQRFIKEHRCLCKDGCNIHDQYCCGKVAFKQLKDYIEYYTINNNNES